MVDVFFLHLQESKQLLFNSCFCGILDTAVISLINDISCNVSTKVIVKVFFYLTIIYLSNFLMDILQGK